MALLPSDRRVVDRIVVGAGIFGLYSAAILVRRGLRVAVIDVEPGPMLRASLVNQARIHNGYHYPRSLFTARRSAHYYDRFATDFPEAVNGHFAKIYAIAAAGSFTDAEGFAKFCAEVGIRAEEVDADRWFRPGAVEAAFETDEYSFDAAVVRRSLLERIRAHGGVDWHLGRSPLAVEQDAGNWVVHLDDGAVIEAPAAINATYAGTNHVLELFGIEVFPIKYELCEVLLVAPPPALAGVGITVMDGPFFSVMPFGHTGTHTLTAVDHTPRATSRAELPTFPCQQHNPACTPEVLDNCALCPVRPGSAWVEMRQLAASYLTEGDRIRFADSLMAVKAILQATEVDDGRPTLIVEHRSSPSLTSILSGKVNTLYDLEGVL
jgi:glycine/D-amino acid oxidase-like deaminating enzyme